MTIHSEILLALEEEASKVESIISRLCEKEGQFARGLAYRYGVLDGLETAMDVVRNRFQFSKLPSW